MNKPQSSPDALDGDDMGKQHAGMTSSDFLTQATVNYVIVKEVIYYSFSATQKEIANENINGVNFTR